jgi:hypothetical protein
MGVPARFVGAPLRASRKPIERDLFLELIPFGLSKGRNSLVEFAGTFLSETAGAGNGLIQSSKGGRPA